MKQTFKGFVAAGLHNPGARLMSVMRAFYLFFARAKVTFIVPLVSDNEEKDEEEYESESESSEEENKEEPNDL